MHPEYTAFSATIPVNDPEKMQAFQEAMNRHHDELNQHIEGLAIELGINSRDAGSIYLFRTRSRWNQPMEDRLVAAFRAGHGGVIFINGDEGDKLDELGF